MIRLIKNELTKVFHKKSIYIVLIVTLAFMILDIALTKILESTVDNWSPYSETNVAFYKEQLSYLDKDDPETKEDYIALSTYIEVGELLSKYEEDSWQEYIIENQAEDIIYNLKYNEGTEEYEMYKKEYDNFIQRLKSDDWKSFVTDELDEVNTYIAQTKALGGDTTTTEYQKQILEWRLEKDISYGYDNSNSLLNEWLQAKNGVYSYEQEQKTRQLTHQEEYQLQQLTGIAEVAEYAITNNENDNVSLSYANNGYELSTNANSGLINVFENYSLFIIIAVVIIAGTIVSEEFHKGTIKLLLVRPYKRTKILLAKLITCLIVLAVVIVAVVLMQFVIGGIANGFSDYALTNTVYNFNTNSIENINIFKYLCLTTVAKLPFFILIMTLAFALSALFNNSPIAIALPLVGMMGAEIINQLAYAYEKAKFLMYFVTPNWDLSIYLFGKMPQFEPISLPFSIVVCIVYFAIMVIASLIVFKKRNIKNV